MDLYQQFIHISRYSRWIPELKRREIYWHETVKRYFDFFQVHLQEEHNYRLTNSAREELEGAVLNLGVMPSMRCLMTAGPALERDHLSAYNCAFVAVDSPNVFSEIMFILMCGTGVGFSVEQKHIDKLPIVAEEFYSTETTIVVADSKLGWSKSLRELISLLYAGQIPQWDLSRVRPAGTILKTFGGRASGPEPLDRLFHFCVHLFTKAKGKRLNSLEVHDLVCMIASIVVVGGVRRSATISLSDLTDERLRKAKSGEWDRLYPERSLANNSAVYNEKPQMGLFMKEWLSLYESHSGERGIFARYAARDKIRKTEKRDWTLIEGVNPCGEIILRNKGLCNLTEAVIRAGDTEESIKRKIRLATILGTFQSTLTKFRFLSKDWAKNAEEERLIGVSLTGIADNPILYNLENAELLRRLKNYVIEVNAEYAKKLKINPAGACTTVKPSGTVSSLVDSSSGIHARHSEYYIRSVRVDRKDPICQFLVDHDFPCEPDIMNKDHIAVFSFPIKSPDGAICRKDISAIDQLKIWLNFARNWCEHNVSCTVSVRENEWLEVAAFVYEHFDEMCGVSFLPYSDFCYKQAPFQECTKEEYEKLLNRLPDSIDWTQFSKYEEKDHTISTHEFACSGHNCEINL